MLLPNLELNLNSNKNKTMIVHNSKTRLGSITKCCFIGFNCLQSIISRRIYNSQIRLIYNVNKSS